MFNVKDSYYHSVLIIHSVLLTDVFILLHTLGIGYPSEQYQLFNNASDKRLDKP